MDSKVIIGLGSGRCGTMSLMHLLNSQPNSNFTHEALPMPWNHNPPEAQSEMFKRLFLRNEEYIGDVGYYWINHTETMLSVKPDAKFICMKRDRQEVVESMWNFTRGLNVHPTDDWFMMSPRYKAEPKEAVGLMWDEYYGLAERLQKQYPKHFVIVLVDKLNSEDGVRCLLDFAGIPKDDQVIETRIWLNKGDEANSC